MAEESSASQSPSQKSPEDPLKQFQVSFNSATSHCFTLYSVIRAFNLGKVLNDASSVRFFLGIFCNLGNLGSIWMGGLDLCWIFT